MHTELNMFTVISYHMITGTFGRIYHGTLLSEGDSHFGADQEITVKAITGTN